MGYDFIVFGATGMQGRIVTRDLLENNYSVLLCGRDKKRVTDLLKRPNTSFKYIQGEDINNLSRVIKKSRTNIVINCMMGDYNLNSLKACLNTNTHSIDLGSIFENTKKQINMDPILKKKGLIHITGCGSVPGIGNVMLRHTLHEFDTIESIDCGFDWDSNIKKFVVPFSIPSIIWEFTDSATIVKDGKYVKIKPMSSITYCYSKAIGKEKCFNETHAENYTFYHYLKERGLKNMRCFAGFPKHSFDKIMTLIELGLGSWDEIKFKGVKIAPVDFLTEVLKNIKYPKGYKETENLWVHIKGKKNGKNKFIKMECIVPTLKGWEDAGCNIDTGMPASIMAQMIKKGIITEKGSFAPEAIVPPEPFFEELRKRNMSVYQNGKLIN